MFGKADLVANFLHDIRILKNLINKKDYDQIKEFLKCDEEYWLSKFKKFEKEEEEEFQKMIKSFK